MFGWFLLESGVIVSFQVNLSGAGNDTITESGLIFFYGSPRVGLY